MNHRLIEKIVCFALLIIVIVLYIPILTFYYPKLMFYNYGSLIAARESFVNHLKVYDAYDKSGSIKFTRLGNDNDGGYVLPEIALEKADVLMGYGVADDISFEEKFSELYKKPSYGFDCGVSQIEIRNDMCHFISECISSDTFLYGNQQSSGKVSSFAQQLQKLDLKNKKIFVKMDIEGAEYEALPEILTYSKMITGIALEIHSTNKTRDIEKVITLLSAIEKDFILVHVHGNNRVIHSFNHTFLLDNVNGVVPTIVELTYINKSLVKNYQISTNQKHPSNLDMPCSKGSEDFSFEIVG